MTKIEYVKAGYKLEYSVTEKLPDAPTGYHFKKVFENGAIVKYVLERDYYFGKKCQCCS